MSIIENIEIKHSLDIGEYLAILIKEFGARNHPAQPDSFLVGEPGLPFYKPKAYPDHVSILGFNGAPLPACLVQALLNHPELVPDDVEILWTQEQELVMNETIGVLRHRLKSKK